MTLECHHTFCRDCISTWLSIRDNCPTCRCEAPEELIPNYGYTEREFVDENGEFVTEIEFLQEGEGVVEMHQDPEGRWYPLIILD